MQTMDGIFTNLKRMFQSGNILSKLIYINVGLFILIRLASVLFMLFNVQGALPSVDVVYLYVHSF